MKEKWHLGVSIYQTADKYFKSVIITIFKVPKRNQTKNKKAGLIMISPKTEISMGT